jgi:integrase
MELVQPIKDIYLLDRFKEELLKKGPKDYLIFDIAINIGIKITDILNLTVWDVKNKSQITIKEDRTNASTNFLIYSSVSDELNSFIDGMAVGDLLFASKKGGKKPITLVQAYKLLNEVGTKLGIDKIGIHTLRKTFGYHHYKKYNDIITLQHIFGHSTTDTTLRYIGIDDMEDNSIEDFFL